MRLSILLVLIYSGTALPISAQKILNLSDRTYEDQIKTVLLYPNSGGQRENLLPAAVPLQEQNLLLEFDDLQNQRNNYYVKIVNCLYNWEKSTLSDLDFMNNYNEYPITDYSFSINTSIRYVHYRFPIPEVKLPGNYLLVVYRENEEDIILSKRFLIYDNRTSFSVDSQMSGTGNLYSTNQQLNFIMSYSQIEVLNPYDAIHTIIRQNQRWDNVRQDVKPSFVREDISQLEYRFFDQGKQFKAGNEFRFVDFRSLNFPGQNTGRLDRSKRPFSLSVAVDRPRENQAYALYPDLNGNFLIENLDYKEAPVSCDYLFVTFYLQTQELKEDVYLIGAFNDWHRNAENKMKYNQHKGMYECTLFLKQGWYNYMYWLEGSENPFQLEGSHFETENLYEVLVYYKPFRPNTDLLVGYFLLPVNKR